MELEPGELGEESVEVRVKVFADQSAVLSLQQGFVKWREG
jgi:hypothetical protein